MGERLIMVLAIVWTIVGLGLSFYLVCFPIFMKKKISVIVNLLERIAAGLEKKEK